ncbi:MAG: hypothetical protein HOP28_13270 [Gemmatimonadales bacterium]|nr:hypothetical protein [Gemmatimonadales bacterium]
MSQSAGVPAPADHPSGALRSGSHLEFGLVGPDVDRPALEADLTALLRKIRERPLAEVSIGDALTSLFRAGSEHQIRNPGALLLLARAFLIAEAVLRRLDPAINVVEVFRVEVDRLLRAGPADLRRLLRRVGDGELGRVSAPALERRWVAPHRWRRLAHRGNARHRGHGVRCTPSASPVAGR